MSWKEPNVGGAGEGEREECAAWRAWQAACARLNAPDAAGAWGQLVDASPPDTIWHSLRNCVAYQTGVWQSLVERGTPDAVQPAAFKLALVLRHTPTELAVKLLGELLARHPQNRDLTSYIVALVTDAEAPPCCAASPASPAGAAPARDLRLFSDCELCALAAPARAYDAHAALVRAEYRDMSAAAYAAFRGKILNQLSKLPKLFHTPEFEPLEAAARQNIDREIRNLRENGAEYAARGS